MKGVYQILNFTTGKRYVGSSKQLEFRMSAHRTYLRGNRHYNSDLQQDWNIYGEQAFAFSILEECSSELLLEHEQRWINFYGGIDSAELYNQITTDKQHSSTQARVKMRASWTAEKRERHRAYHLGRKASDETKLKMSITRKGRSRDEETKVKISETLKGHEVSDERRNKISESLKKRNAANPKPPRTEEEKRKISERMKKVWEERRNTLHKQN